MTVAPAMILILAVTLVLVTAIAMPMVMILVVFALPTPTIHVPDTAVVIMSVPAVPVSGMTFFTKIPVDDDEVPVPGTQVDDPLRRNTVIIGHEPEVDQVDDVVVIEDHDPAPLLLVITVCLSIRWTGHVTAGQRDVIDIGGKAEIKGDIIPAPASMAQVDDSRRRAPGRPCNVINNRDFPGRKSTVPDKVEIPFRHSVIVPNGEVERAEVAVEETRPDIPREFRPCVWGPNEQKRHNGKQKMSSCHDRRTSFIVIPKSVGYVFNLAIFQNKPTAGVFVE